MTMRPPSLISTASKKQGRIFEDGFTIIELMIVVTVISILLVISIPIYQQYTARAQASEGLSLAGGLKQHVGEIMLFQGGIPNGGTPGIVVANAFAGLPSPSSISGEYVESVTLYANAACTDPANNCYPSDGTLEVQYRVATTFGPLKMAIQPRFLTGAIKWDCTLDLAASNPGRADHVPEQFRPPVCRP
jgi:type IV pilus assembly protein PilA